MIFFQRLFLLLVCASVSSIVFGQTEKRDLLLKEINSLRSDLSALETQLIEPSGEDRANYSEFLRQSGTGLIRILPRGKFEKQLTIRGGGAYYSFARLTHEYGYGSDLELQNGKLLVGFAGADYGMIINLGDVALEDITLETPEIQYLVNYETPSAETNARAEARNFAKGIEQNGILYKSSAPAIINNTYVLRSINFDDSDVLVAFRVVRKETDESLILAWKILRKFAQPRLQRAAIVNQ